MHVRSTFLTPLLLLFFFTGYSQSETSNDVLAKIRQEGFQNSQVMNMVSELTDVYGQRLTGSREYLAAAKWTAQHMKDLGFQNVHFENFCPECRGWSVKGFNLEMTSPNYMKIVGYPLDMSKSTNGVVSGEIVHIEIGDDADAYKTEFDGKLKGKIILWGKVPASKSLDEPLSHRYTDDQLLKMQEKLSPENKKRYLPDLLRLWETPDTVEDDFLRFAESQGALAVLTARSNVTGIIRASGPYYDKEGALQPLPYFTIRSEHFGRLVRMLELGTVPVVRINLETELYHEPQNNVDIIGELTGTDANLKKEQILIGAHFDSWHSATGATDNGANCMVLMEALRILKVTGYKPRRTIRIGLWGGEEEAFYGSAAYAIAHFGPFDKDPNAESKQVSAYLNLDNGVGAIRGINLQANDIARPVFARIFKPLADICDGIITIENEQDTDHETFDYYNIPSFQFIQDPLAYETVTHHSDLDLYEYVPEDDVKKNAVLLASVIYSLDQMTEKVPRK